MSRPRHPLRETRDATIRQHWTTMTSGQLGAKLAMDPSEIRKAARRLGLPSKAHGPRAMAMHGTRSRYQGGCHCRACTDAQSTYIREYKARRASGKPAVQRALATRLNNNGQTGHGSLARAKAGCDCPRCEKALAEKYQPNGPPMWRCPCDDYRVHAGAVTTCPACGTVPGWATNREPERRMG